MVAMEFQYTLLYRILWRTAFPWIKWYVRKKDVARLVTSSATAERFGHSNPPDEWRRSSAGRRIWIHGASVGECISVLPIVEFLLSERSSSESVHVLLTTTTASARDMIRKRIQENHATMARVCCVFAPLDHPDCVNRFYDAWKPNAGLLVESELWPNLIMEADKRKIQIGLINGRISTNSMRLWTVPGIRTFAAHFMSKFSIVLCQDASNQARFLQLGAVHADVVPNLKFAYNSNADSHPQKHCFRHVVWCAVSTHDGEEVLMARVLTSLQCQLTKHENIRPLCVIIPRHPERTLSIIETLRGQFPQLRIETRTGEGSPSRAADIFIVDTMAETEKVFKLIPTVVMGGSFVPCGGHNPIEPLRAGCHVIVGPHMENFTDILSLVQEQCPLVQSVQSIDQLESHLLRRFRQKLSRTTHKLQHSDKSKHVMRRLGISVITEYEKRLRRMLKEA